MATRKVIQWAIVRRRPGGLIVTGTCVVCHNCIETRERGFVDGSPAKAVVRRWVAEHVELHREKV